MTRWFFAAAAAGLFLTGCKDKLTRCQESCDRIADKDVAKCAGSNEASCKGAAEDLRASCKSLCGVAHGKGGDGGAGASPANATASAASVAVDPDEAACAKGEAHACETLAERCYLGRGAPKDQARAAELFDKACGLGAAFSCESLGKMYRDGKGVAKDDAKSTALLQKGCDGGSFGACTSLGLAALGAGDKPSGVRLLTKACDGDDAIGCTGLGGLYLHGNGVKKDARRAKQLLEKACRLGQKKACETAATIR